jgi:hypothetical protein
MFKRRTAAERNALMRSNWLRLKKQGKSRFIWRQISGSLLFWLILSLGLDPLIDHPHSTVQSIIVINLFTLPIFLLGGYLEGRWKWADLEKKFPGDSLPPWE